MAAGLEAALAGSPLADRMSGWVNVPADCVRPLQRIHLHAARAPGVNEPTAAGVAGANEILRRVRQLSARRSLPRAPLWRSQCAVACARTGHFARRQARRHPAVDGGRGDDQRTQLRSQASLGDQGGQSGPRGRQRPRRRADYFRRDRRSARRDRFRARRWPIGPRLPTHWLFSSESPAGAVTCRRAFGHSWKSKRSALARPAASGHGVEFCHRQ